MAQRWNQSCADCGREYRNEFQGIAASNPWILPIATKVHLQSATYKAREGDQETKTPIWIATDLLRMEKSWLRTWCRGIQLSRLSCLSSSGLVKWWSRRPCSTRVEKGYKGSHLRRGAFVYPAYEILLQMHIEEGTSWWILWTSCPCIVAGAIVLAQDELSDVPVTFVQRLDCYRDCKDRH